ncbi:hypothetical protein ABT56_22450 [Photobacterium aquae]|uniref:Uncharacterized protein n=1 Tax=Photobacterium aquae TaxID=1195763 RepID=A0A0J1GN48_9GAMM|nr:hypothetical protein [Photobacterium aquae]KLV00874.1 hypothetical protein ABT56_22450 [Photobacterium aquae]
MTHNIIFPKRAPATLIKKAEKVLLKLQQGKAECRKSVRYGYQTLVLGGRGERMVITKSAIYCFNNHRDYETFINNPAYQ